ncbi:MAG: hypothetical protein U0105_02410 [Candidatus Obscuribacterales bacterium]
MGADQPIQGESFRVAGQPDIGPGVQAAVLSGFEDFGSIRSAMTDSSANTGLHSVEFLPDTKGGTADPPVTGMPAEPTPKEPEKPVPPPPEQPPAPKPPSLLDQLQDWKPPPGFPYGPGCPPPEPPPCC